MSLPEVSRPDPPEVLTAPPPPTTELDRDLLDVITRNRRIMFTALAILAVALLVGFALVGFAVTSQGEKLSGQATRVSSACLLLRDLSALSSSFGFSKEKPRALDVIVAADSRLTYNGLGCQPHLKPDPSLAFWAHYYRLDLNRVPGH